MDPKCVLITSCFYEPNVNEVVRRLDARGVRWIRLNTETFPLVARVELRCSTEDGPYAVLTLSGRRVDSREVTSVWNRRQGELILADGLGEDEREFTRSECVGALHGFFDYLDCRWVNPRFDEQRASGKPLQLAMARDMGLSIPRTLVTNDPTALREFIATSPGRVLFKPMGGATRLSQVDYSAQVQAAYAGDFAAPPAPPSPRNGRNDESFSVLFSQILTEDKLPFIDGLVSCPAIFQDYVEKRSELRVTIVGDRVFAAEIFSQDHEETRVDFRSLGLLPRDQIPRHAPCSLPSDIEGRLMALMRHLGLVFACVDLILTPDGDYVFLEINPSGQWGWIEHLTGLPITDALVDLLAS